MNINLQIIDQRVSKLADELKSNALQTPHLRIHDIERARSLAWVLLCVMQLIDIERDEAMEYLTDGADDGGIDALHVTNIVNSEFTVTLFQGKYVRKSEGGNAFPENTIAQLIGTVGALFDPDKEIHLHPMLNARVEEIRSFVRDGSVPNVRVVLCNNGSKWSHAAQKRIDATGFGEQVVWDFANHDTLIQLMQAPKSVSGSLALSGRVIVEDFNFRRVLIGKAPVESIRALFETHGDKLLERNIRRYLGLNKNKVNLAIRDTLLDPLKSANFYFYNNGVTMTCSKFRHNALQEANRSVQVEDLQVINGGQTCMTIHETLAQHGDTDTKDAYVLIRLYELAQDDDMIHDITFATNSQNPVDLRDLRANDAIQKTLEHGIAQLGFTYRRKRDASSANENSIAVSAAAEAILAVWRGEPHKAKFMTRELFGKHYDRIFSEDLVPAQVILAWTIFRFVEAERRRRSGALGDRPFTPYASHFLAMIIGELFLEHGAQSLADINNRTHADNLARFELFKDRFYKGAEARLSKALRQEGLAKPETSLQRLAAAFRRGDLIAALRKAKAIERTKVAR